MQTLQQAITYYSKECFPDKALELLNILLRGSLLIEES